MNAATWSLLAAVALFIGMSVLGEIGRRLALERVGTGDVSGENAGLGVLDGAVFGLLGLIVAFSFAGAAGRFDESRELIVEETNAIGSTYQLLDLLPDDSRPALQQLFRDYLDSRITLYDVLPDMGAATVQLEAARAIKTRIWATAVDATEGNQPATMLLLPSINAMFDVATKRTMSMILHPPLMIFALMFVLALTSALLAGYGMARPRSRDWIRLVGFAAIAATAVYVILDIEFPRSGLIQIDTFDIALVDLRTSME